MGIWMLNKAGITNNKARVKINKSCTVSLRGATWNWFIWMKNNRPSWDELALASFWLTINDGADGEEENLIRGR